MTNFALSERLALFPSSARVKEFHGTNHLTINGISLQELAKEFGTPLYVYDRACMDEAVATYRNALENEYPGEWGLTYAGKAFLCLAIGEWIKEQKLWLDCTGANELEIAVKAQIPRDKLLQHGVSKTNEDLIAALKWAGTIVIDNLNEIERFIQIADSEPFSLPEIWLRLRPGRDVETHHYTQTGGKNSKFGFSRNEFEFGLELLIRNGINPKGLHFHLGSHFNDPNPLAPAIESALDLVKHIADKLEWEPRIFCPGGGWGVPYHETELPHKTIAEYVRCLSKTLVAGCEKRGLNLPHLQLEPGRSIIAKAGVAVYQIQTVKNAGDRRWLLVDGGLADNPRPALYQARYSALPVIKPERKSAGPAWIGGPFCESGDVLIQALPFAVVEPGEFIAVPVSGAYQLSMGSNYNGAFKPCVIWLEDGTPRKIRRRETIEDLIRLDLHLHD